LLAFFLKLDLLLTGPRVRAHACVCCCIRPLAENGV